MTRSPAIADQNQNKKNQNIFILGKISKDESLTNSDERFRVVFASYTILLLDIMY